MASDWVETTLGDISTDVSYGYTESANTEKVGPKFLRITDIQNGVVDWKSVPYCPIDNSKLDKYLLERGDIVVARTGNSTGENYIFTGSEETVYASYLIRFRVDENIANPFYVWYSMRSPNWWAFVNSSKTGSAQAGANAKVLGLYPLDLPNLDTQKAIAHILGSLDDKIELNRQMNATLEAMAQALFKSWFVDFDPVIDNALVAGNPIPDELLERAEQRKEIEKADNSDIQNLFPNEFEFTEEMGWIPKGWGISEVKDFGQVVCGKTPSKKKAEYYGNDISFIKIPDMHDVAWATTTTDNLSFEGSNSQKNKLIPKGSICVSCIATVGKVLITSREAHTNQQINSVIPAEKNTLYYLYSSFLAMEKNLQDLASGGAVTLNLNTSNFSKIKIILPPSLVLDAYDSAVNSLYEKNLKLLIQNQELAKLRDTLLPKLMSGELRIPDADAMTKEV